MPRSVTINCPGENELYVCTGMAYHHSTCAYNLKIREGELCKTNIETEPFFSWYVLGENTRLADVLAVYPSGRVGACTFLVEFSVTVHVPVEGLSNDWDFMVYVPGRKCVMSEALCSVSKTTPSGSTLSLSGSATVAYSLQSHGIFLTACIDHGDPSPAVYSASLAVSDILWKITCV